MTEQPSQPPPSPKEATPWWPFALSAVVGVIAAALHGLDQEEKDVPFVVGQSLLYVAPLLNGILGGIVRPRRATFALLLTLTTLVIAAPLMGSGLVCLIFIVPINLVVAPFTSLITGRIVILRQQKRAGTVGVETTLLLIPLALLASEALVPGELPARETLSHSVVVALPRQAVWQSLDTLNMELTTPAPWPVGVLTPKPLCIVGGGSSVGSERRVMFENGVLLATVTRSQAPERFTFTLSVEQSGREFFDHWSVPGDSSFILEAIDEGHTRVTHTTSYVPLSVPRWYFGPGERWLGDRIQSYMLEAYAKAVTDQRETWLRSVASP